MIKAIFLANGFKEKTQEDGTVDLNPYVYDAVEALLKSVADDSIVKIEGYKHVAGETLHLTREAAPPASRFEWDTEELMSVRQHQCIIALIQGTPAARWREEGQPDPHQDTARRERSQLAMGYLTDDELANAVYLKPNIAQLTGAKERIRWLSRKLEDATKDTPCGERGGDQR